jgi:superoxide dismutase, Cu-Zn family
MTLKTPMCLLLAMAMATSVAPSVAQGTAPRVWTVEGQAPAISAVADILNTSNTLIGRAQFRQGPKGVLIDLSASMLSPGAHGVHLHAVGQCDATQKFASAAHHIGLNVKPHGFLNPKDHHAGDLPNLIVDANGNGSAQFYTHDIRISGKLRKGQMLLLDADGSSLIIHDKADDGFAQPSGGAGGRVACGSIKLP